MRDGPLMTPKARVRKSVPSPREVEHRSHCDQTCGDQGQPARGGFGVDLVSLVSQRQTQSPHQSRHQGNSEDAGREARDREQSRQLWFRPLEITHAPAGPDDPEWDLDESADDRQGPHQRDHHTGDQIGWDTHDASVGT